MTDFVLAGDDTIVFKILKGCETFEREKYECSKLLANYTTNINEFTFTNSLYI